MARLRTLQSSFTSGELDPRLAARSDARIYYSGAARMKNALVMPMGGFRRRPGLSYVATIGDAAAGARLVSFSFNTEQTYLFVFVATKVYVFRDDALVHTITGAPWSAAQVGQINWAQSADTLIVVHNDVQPHTISRGATHTSWSLAALNFSNIPTYNFGSGAEAVISATRGWPAAVTFHQSRLWLGGLRSRPATLLASKVGSFFDLNKGTSLDDEAIDITLDTDEVNAIYNLHSGRNLTILTSGAEHAITVAPPITPKNVAVQEQSRRGSKRYVRPVEIDGALLFVQDGGKAVREFLFQQLEDAYQANILSLLAPHLVKDPGDFVIRKGNSFDDADYVVAANSDGTSTVLNTLRAQEVNAFSECQTDGVCVRTGVVGGAVYWLVQRTVGGAPVYFIEKWNDASTTDANVRAARPAAAAHVASAGQTVFAWSAAVSVGAVTVRKNGVTLELGAHYTVSGLPGTSGSVTLLSPASAGDAVTISFPLASLGGLGHLEGRTVKVIVDGLMQADKVVAAGAIALDPPAESDIEAGLDYQLEVTTMPLEGRLPDGTMVGKKTRIVRAVVRLYETKSIRINGQSIAFRRIGPEGIGPLDAPLEAMTGDFKIDGLQGWSGRAQLTITQDAPLPLTVLGIAQTVSV
jgi:hypothetical protein